MRYCSHEFKVSLRTQQLASLVLRIYLLKILSRNDYSPMLGPYPDALSEWGGKNSPMIVEDGQWWRLLTPILLHAGLIHLAGESIPT